jgi:hypothetical protein
MISLVVFARLVILSSRLGRGEGPVRLPLLLQYIVFVRVPCLATQAGFPLDADYLPSESWNGAGL